MWQRMTDINVAREYLAAGLLYENKVSPRSANPVWGRPDRYTLQQLDGLEADDPDCVRMWPISDYAIYVEE